MQNQSLLQEPLSWEEPHPSVSYREIHEILRRRWGVLLATFLVVTAVGAVATKLTKPTYRATASLLVQGPSNNINSVDTTNPLSSLLAPRPEQSVETQVRILESDQLQEKVRKSLKSLPRITVSPVEKTNIVEVSAEGSDPVLVGQAPNLLLNAYIKQMAYDSAADVREARKTTETGAEAAQKRMEDAEKALQTFKQTRKLPEFAQSRAAVLGEVESLSTQYRETQASLASVQAEIVALKTRLKATSATSPTLASQETDPAIQETEKSIVALQAQRAELSERFTSSSGVPANQAELNALFPNRYTGKATPLAEVDARLAVLQQRLAQQRKTFKPRNEQLNPVRRSLENSLGDSQVRASSLSATAATISRNLAAALAHLDSFPAWEREMAQLERTLANARRDYNMYSQQRDKLRLSEQMPRTSSYIFQDAKQPDTPIAPNRKQNLIVSAGLGLFFGVVFVLLLEYFDDRINSKEDIDQLLHLPSLGAIPRIEGTALLRNLPLLSPMAEAYRELRTSINFAALDDVPKTIVVTSAKRGEGKSVTALNLATALAMDGKRVIVVDADLRDPSQHLMQNVPPSPGLTDLLIGTHEISEVLRPTSANHLTLLIPAGTIPPNPAELMGSAMMANFVEAVRDLADVIIFDTPPTLAASDAVLLSSHADATLLVVSEGEATRTDVKHTVELLRRARARILGVVLNNTRTVGPSYAYAAPAQNSPNGSRRLEEPAEGRELWGTQVFKEKIEAGRTERFQFAFEERAREAASLARRRARATSREVSPAPPLIDEDATLDSGRVETIRPEDL